MKRQLICVYLIKAQHIYKILAFAFDKICLSFYIYKVGWLVPPILFSAKVIFSRFGPVVIAMCGHVGLGNRVKGR